jgi:hypothetical protein
LRYLSLFFIATLLVFEILVLFRVKTTGSGSGMVIIDIVMGNGVLPISSSNIGPDFTTYPDNDLYFQTCLSDALQGKAMA